MDKVQKHNSFNASTPACEYTFAAVLMGSLSEHVLNMPGK
jgi:hypothetical protein